MKTIALILALVIWGSQSSIGQNYEISGEMKTYHRVTISFDGPQTAEHAEVNPFLDYRLDVTFTNGESQYQVPGFYAADGNAGESGANAGNIWQVRFSPDQPGTWSFSTSFRQGKAIAVSDDPEAGQGVHFDGASGTFDISATDKAEPDFRAKGRLKYVGGRYLQFSKTQDYFLKAGADSPENFLGYYEFDQTPPTHKYEPHSNDWKEGDPTWKDGKGKNIIGALNYLASKKMNSVYMLTMNIQADGKDVWPWSDVNERYRFDCSKLDQWEVVFTHMDQLGLMQHFVTQETENELLLDIGFTQTQRKLYYRELAARFAHHPAITWNLGEENGISHWTLIGQDDDQRKAMADYLKKVDPYNNFVVLHTHSDDVARDSILTPLLGHPTLDGPSLQIGSVYDVHRVTKDWIEQSDKSAKKWVVNLDEIGQYWKGVLPDSYDPDHDTVRQEALWGNLMAGGAGVEWYFGYKFPHADLNCEDWRSRDLMWDQTRVATQFFQDHLPFTQMTSHDQLVDSKAYCLADPGQVYTVYLKPGAAAQLDLSGQEGNYQVWWFDPKAGGDLQKSKVKKVKGGSMVTLGESPDKPDQDWVVLVRK